MSQLLPPLPAFMAFLAATFVLAVTPGPGVFYIVTRSLSQGRLYGLASVAGVAVGNFINAVGAAIGLAAIFAVSSVAFMAVKYAGAAYLIWLGFKAFRAKGEKTPADVVVKAASLGRIFTDGFAVAVLNPKTTLFFAAFLPQFIGAGTHPAAQSVLLGFIFVVIAALTDSCYALAAGAVRPWLARPGAIFARAGNYLTGSVFVGMGLLTAFSGRGK